MDMRVCLLDFFSPRDLDQQKIRTSLWHYEFRAPFHIKQPVFLGGRVAAEFGGSHWPNGRIQIFGPTALTSFFTWQAQSIFLYK